MPSRMRDAALNTQSPPGKAASDRVATGLLLAGALLFRLLLVVVSPETWQVDIDAYLEIARNLLDGAGFARGQPPFVTAYRPPLYPLLLAAVQGVGGTPVAMGVVQALWGTATVWMTLRCGATLGWGNHRFLAALCVAGDPLLMQYTILPMTETLCAGLVIATMWNECVLQQVSVPQGTLRLRHQFLTGMLWGLLCLSRPTFLAAAGLAGVLKLACDRVQSWPLRGSLLRIAVWGAGLVVCISPWVIRNTLVFGKPIVATTHGGYTLLLANNPVFYAEVVQQPRGTVWSGASLARWQAQLEAEMQAAGIAEHDEVARDHWMQQRARTHIREQPQLFLQACLWRAMRFWDFAPWVPGTRLRHLLWGVVLLYALVSVGLIVSLSISLYSLRTDWRSVLCAWPLWAIPLVLFAAHLFYWTDMRMRAPVIPLLTLSSAAGWEHLRQRFSKSSLR